jgi:hypothetical protein
VSRKYVGGRARCFWPVQSLAAAAQSSLLAACKTLENRHQQQKPTLRAASVLICCVYQLADISLAQRLRVCALCRAVPRPTTSRLSPRGSSTMTDRDALVLTLIRGLEGATMALDVVDDASRSAACSRRRRDGCSRRSPLPRRHRRRPKRPTRPTRLTRPRRRARRPRSPPKKSPRSSASPRPPSSSRASTICRRTRSAPSRRSRTSRRSPASRLAGRCATLPRSCRRGSSIPWC